LKSKKLPDSKVSGSVLRGWVVAAGTISHSFLALFCIEIGSIPFKSKIELIYQRSTSG
jgi:hypothetical protein